MPIVAGLGIACALWGAMAQPPAEPAFDRPTGAERTTRIGTGLMLGGGAVMVVGAGVLVPIALTRAMNTHPPQPGDYSDVPTFQRDLVDYQWSMHRAMLLGVAGAVTSIAGAAIFSAGAITFGVGRRRARRVASRLSLRIVPLPGSPSGAVSLRF